MLPAKTMFVKSSHLTQEAIALYVDALKLDKTSQLPEDLLVHVADCELCKTEVTELFSMLEGEQYDRGETHPYFDTVRQKGRRKSWPAHRIAAILLLGAGVGLLVYYFNVSNEGRKLTSLPHPSRQAEARSDSTTAVPKRSATAGEPGKEVYAGNFDVSPNLEPLVGNELRSGAIQVLSPLNGAEVGERILFDWKGDGKGPLVLKVLTNAERVLVWRTLSNPRLELSMQLSPGLYYWKVESEGELRYVGKFFVR